MAKLELLVSILKGFKFCGNTSTGAKVTASLRALKACHFLLAQTHGWLAQIRSKRGYTIVKKSCMNLLWKLTKPKSA